MIRDKLLACWDAAAITVTAVSSSVDLLATGIDLSRADTPMRAVVYVDTAFTAVGSATATFELIEAADADLTSGIVSLYTTGAIGKATLVVGYKVMDVLIPATAKRYIGYRVTVATPPMTAGAVTAEFVADTQTNIPGRRIGWTGI